MDPRTERVLKTFENLYPDTIDTLAMLYAEQATFKDPFNEVKGRAAIVRIFKHMFDTVDVPRFKVLQAITEGDQAFLTWDFTFQRKGQAMRIHGASHLCFDAQGRITLHRDYWDAAEELYAKLPVLGSLMRWLQRRLKA